jgi:GNAT superfamily N-acetyltransferase
MAESTPGVRHPHHDAVAQEVRSWYTDWPGRSPGPGSDPDLGVRTHQEPFGYLREGPGPAGRRLILTVDDSVEASAALDAATAFYRSEAFDVWVDDRGRAKRLDSVLVSAGFEAPDNTVVLALVGPLRAARGPAGLEVREVTNEDDLRAWARVRLMGFADSEAEPTAMAVDERTTALRTEWPISRYEMGILHREPVAVIAHYTASADQMVFNLATRTPFRHRGIAQALLWRWSEQATMRGARSVLINCDEHGLPADLYRRMGFVDEVYWHRRYQRLSGS